MSWATWAIVRGPAWSTSSPGRLELGFEVPRGPPEPPGNSRSGPRAHGFDQFPQATRAWAECSQDRQISWATHARVRGPVVSTSCPGGFAPVSDCPECPQALPGDSGHCPRARDVDQLSQATRTQFRGPAASPGSQGRHAPGSDRPQGAPAVPGDSGQCPSARDVDHPCWVTPARV